MSIESYSNIITVHWSILDPDEKEGSAEEKTKELRKSRNEIKKNLFINLHMGKLD